MSQDNLNNNALYIITNVRDSDKIAYHKLCNHGLSDFDLGCPLRQALALSESRILDPLGVLDLGGFFF